MELQEVTYEVLATGDKMPSGYYMKADVDAAIAELKADVNNLLMQNRELCQALQAMYSAEEYMKLQAEKDKEIAKLKEKLMPCLNGDCILTCEVIEKYGKENAELKQKLENVQTSMYADVVDANMENRRLKRALWLARARRAEARKNYWYARSCHEGDDFLVSIDGSPVKYIGCIKRTNYDWLLTWSEVESKCRAKAKEYR